MLVDDIQAERYTVEHSLACHCGYGNKDNNEEYFI
jgi:hypothetical protein